MREHCSDEQLSSYLDGDLAPAQAGLVAEHIAVCPACRRASAELRGLREAAAGLAQLEPPDRVRQAIQSRIEQSRSTYQPARLPQWTWVGLPALAAAAALVAFMWGQRPVSSGETADVHSREQVATDYQEYVHGIDHAMSECREAMKENPGNARVQSAYRSARDSRTGALDHLVSGGD